MSKRMSRRKFAVVVGGAAVAAAAGASAAEAVRGRGRSKDPPLHKQQPTPQEAAKPEAKPKYGMTAEQEEQVRQAVERGARGRAALRNYKFEYADEPAFVFRAKVKR